MTKRLLLSILGIVLAFCFLAIGCQVEPLSSDATIKGVTVNGVTAILGTPDSDYTKGVAGHVDLSDAQMIDAEIIVSKSDEDADVFYAQGTYGVRPIFVRESTFTFQHMDCLFIEIFSANLDQYLIYQIIVHKRTPLLSDITLAGRSAVSLGTPGETGNTATEGEIWFGSSQNGQNLAVMADPEIPTTTYKISKTSGDTTPVFTNIGDIVADSVVDGDFIYVETSSGEEQGDKLVYKLKVVKKGDSRRLTSVTINDMPMAIGAMGTSSFPGDESFGNYVNGAALATTGNRGLYRPPSGVPWSGIIVMADPEDPNAKVEYDHTYDERDFLMEFANDNGNLGNVPTGEFIAVRVTSEIGEESWYKFRVAVGDSSAALSQIKVGPYTGTPGIGDSFRFSGGLVTFLGTPGYVSIPLAYINTNLEISAVKSPGSENAILKFAKASRNGNNLVPPVSMIYPPGNTTHGPSGELFDDGLDSEGAFIEVTSQDRLTVNYYNITFVLDITTQEDLQAGLGDFSRTYPFPMIISDDITISGNMVVPAATPYTLAKTVFINSGKVLTVPSGAALTIETGATINVDGTLKIGATAGGRVDGTINIRNGGTIENEITSEYPDNYDTTWPWARNTAQRGGGSIVLSNGGHYCEVNTVQAVNFDYADIFRGTGSSTVTFLANGKTIGGSVTLNADLGVQHDDTLTISQGATLTVDSNRILAFGSNPDGSNLVSSQIGRFALTGTSAANTGKILGVDHTSTVLLQPGKYAISIPSGAHTGLTVNSEPGTYKWTTGRWEKE
jgi:hypothetical protein